MPRNIEASEPLDFATFSNLIRSSREHWIQRKHEIANALSEQPLLLFGFGGKGQALAHQIRELAGREITIYDTSSAKRDAARSQGFPAIDEIIDTSGTNWLSILGACQAQFEQQQSIATPILYFQEAASYFNVPYLAHNISDFGDYVYAHLEDHYNVYSALHPSSRDRFLAVLRFRVSNDPRLIRSFRQQASEMWLDIPEAFKIKDYNSFLDVGAYDGDTLNYYRHRFGCTKGFAVEANTSLFDSIHQVADSYPHGISILPMAAWSHNTRLGFEEVGGGMIQVIESPDGELQAAPIVDFVHEEIDCIKMDIEGAESYALEGCRGLISSYRPDLAIAAYHRQQDLTELYKQIRRLGYTGPGISWHFAHYSDCIDDSIFYILTE